MKIQKIIIIACLALQATTMKAPYGGIIPVSVDPKTHQAVFLLGLRHDNTWGDFGGKKDKKDKTLAAVARREGLEELMIAASGWVNSSPVYTAKVFNTAFANSSFIQEKEKGVQAGLGLAQINLVELPYAPKSAWIDCKNKITNEKNVPRVAKEARDFKHVSLDTIISAIQSESPITIDDKPLWETTSLAFQQNLPALIDLRDRIQQSPWIRAIYKSATRQINDYQ